MTTIFNIVRVASQYPQLVPRGMERKNSRCTSFLCWKLYSDINFNNTCDTYQLLFACKQNPIKYWKRIGEYELKFTWIRHAMYLSILSPCFPRESFSEEKKKILNNYCKSLHLGTRSLTLSIIFFSDFSDLIPNLGMHFPTRSTHTRDLVKGCEHFVVYIL